MSYLARLRQINRHGPVRPKVATQRLRDGAGEQGRVGEANASAPSEIAGSGSPLSAGPVPSAPEAPNAPQPSAPRSQGAGIPSKPPTTEPQNAGHVASAEDGTPIASPLPPASLLSPDAPAVRDRRQPASPDQPAPSAKAESRAQRQVPQDDVMRSTPVSEDLRASNATDEVETNGSAGPSPFETSMAPTSLPVAGAIARPDLPMPLRPNSPVERRSGVESEIQIDPDAARPIETTAAPPVPTLDWPDETTSTRAAAPAPNAHRRSVPQQQLPPDLPSPPPPKVEVRIGEVLVDIEAPAPLAPFEAPSPPPPQRQQRSSPDRGIWSGGRDLSRHYLRGR